MAFHLTVVEDGSDRIFNTAVHEQLVSPPVEGNQLLQLREVALLALQLRLYLLLEGNQPLNEIIEGFIAVAFSFQKVENSEKIILPVFFGRNLLRNSLFANFGINFLEQRGNSLAAVVVVVVFPFVARARSLGGWG